MLDHFQTVALFQKPAQTHGPAVGAFSPGFEQEVVARFIQDPFSIVYAAVYVGDGQGAISTTLAFRQELGACCRL